MPKHTLALARRVIQQLIRDRRTLGLILVVPVIVMTLIGYSLPDRSLLNAAAPALLAMMAFFMSFLCLCVKAPEKRYSWIKRGLGYPKRKEDEQ